MATQRSDRPIAPERELALLGGQTVTLRLDLYALRRFREATGVSVLTGGLESLNEELLGSLLWACAVRDAPDLELEDVEAGVPAAELLPLLEWIALSLAGSMPEPAEDGAEPAADPTPTRRPAKRRPTKAKNR